MPPKRKVVKGKSASAAKKKPAKSKTTKSKTATKKRPRGDDDGRSGALAAKRVKELKPMERLDQAMKAFKWWEAPPLEDGKLWTYLEHPGVFFPPAYEPHGIKMLYDGKEVDLTPDQEEIATFYALVPPDGPQLSDPVTAKLFNKNFFKDFLALLGPGHVIKEFEKCDFGPIRRYLEEKKEEKKALSKDDKETAKEERLTLQMKYGFAILDHNRIEKLGNWTIEPPSLFRGRGVHPRMGVLKQRVMPEDITINVASGAPVPRCPIPGHNWKKVIHDPTVTWLAFWKENVMDSFKYVFLSASSAFKGKSDRDKYEKARRLCLFIGAIRETYETKLRSKDIEERQHATAMWIIDRLALRVGNEKEEDEADTVGCCSLRVEHISFPGDFQIEMDFLGKDSMRFNQVIDLGSDDYKPIGEVVFANIQAFCQKKKPTEEVFDKITPSSLNRELTSIMPGLSAKVFRTYNASITLENELANMPLTAPPAEKLVEYNRANRQVAILCNHQRSVPKGYDAQMEKLQEQEGLMQSQLKELQAMLKRVASGKTVAKLKTPDADKELRAKETHLFARQPTEDQVKTKIANLKKRIANHKLKVKNKADNKAVALGTSKINYMDPRITVAWCKRIEFPIEKVFARTLRDKFPWAMSVSPSWTFQVEKEADLDF